MKKFPVAILLLAFAVVIYSCGSSSDKTESATEEKASVTKSTITPVVNVSAIAGKSPEEVEAILGKAESTEKASPGGTPCKENPCDKSFYQAEKFEVIFINGKADWITVNNLSDHELNENNIALLGLSPSTPAFSNPNIIRWENDDGIKQVSFLSNGAGKIDYADVKVATK